MAFFAERVGSALDCEFASLTVAKKSRFWAVGTLIDLVALYGRGDDDDAAAVVIGLTGTEVPHYHYFLYRMSRASQARVEAKRRTHRLVPEPANSEGAEG